MSEKTRRSFVKQSALTTAGLGALATGVGAAQDRVRLTADDAIRKQLDLADIEFPGGGVSTMASWPVSFSFDVAPGEGKFGDSPAIAEGAYYDFDLSYSPELTVAIGFLDTATGEFNGYKVTGSNLYRVEAPVSIPEDSAAVGVFNLSDNSRAVSGDLSVTN
ncbi:hypothetical protein [Halorussus sp. MSC15.2]|uniref:hypothetical protein n=1 Tax=Halorussus sp. MSC15.2 TaxID=2283638 RepID=UPI0013D6665A|nr:hypothetical protein [Halorussus sp. MSC15.2]NEU55671.1 hypothetical protein [Halorussus sp. MSC15.2]